MKFIIGIVLALAFVFVLRTPIKKAPLLFYGLALALSGLLVYGTFASLPVWLWKYFMFIVQNNIFAITLFSVVMYTGVLKEGSWLKRYLQPVRAELSILACFVSLGHAVVFTQVYVQRMFTFLSALSVYQLLATIIAVCGVLVLMAILLVTSFKAVHGRMPSVLWKRIQWLAYPFYLLLYVHIILFLLPTAIGHESEVFVKIGVYTLLFGGYLVLRIRKHVLDSRTAMASAGLTAAALREGER